MTKLRPDIDEYFLEIAKVVSTRSTCLRHKVGAVLVRDKQILSTGYNGAAAGAKDCLELGCLRDQQKIKSGTRHEVCRAIHAEQNAIIQSALHGVTTQGATMYCTHTPCILCAKIMVNAGIKRIVCIHSYPDDEPRKLFDEVGVKLEIHEEPSFNEAMVSEQVLAVSEGIFRKAGGFEGFKKFDQTFYDELLHNIRYINRDDAESDESWKQIIPYVIIHNNDDYLVMQRLPRSGEKRLHNAYTFGVGGHINPADSTSEAEGADVIERGMIRELNEEVWIDDLKNIKLVGFVYDTEQEVSRHHLGFVYDAEVGSNEVKVLEEDKLKGFFVKKSEMPKYIDGNENWAEIVYKNYISKLK